MHRLGNSPGDLVRLVRAGARGDVAAFGCLYDAVAPSVYGVALRVLDDVSAAEDVTEEVLVEVWHTAGRFDPARGSVRSWVMALAHRRAVDRARAVGAAARRNQTLPPPVPDAGAVGTAWLHLSADQRQALGLAYFAGRTHGEIARSLALQLDTAASRIRDGLLELKLLLEPHRGARPPSG
jgi:RNA polymerase sigma-70 factor, ECF subfamily